MQFAGVCGYRDVQAAQFAKQLNITGPLIDLKSVTTNVFYILRMNSVDQHTTSGKENLKGSTRNRPE